MERDIQEVLDYWFGPFDDEGLCSDSRWAFWFFEGEKYDEEIRERFSPLVERALAEGLQWSQYGVEGALAEIIVLDQFTRHLYRKTAKAFAGDELALLLAKSAINKAEDLSLHFAQRIFMYLPLEHSESYEDQQFSVGMYKRLLIQVPEEAKEAYTKCYEFAELHSQIIAQFGRYPYRNKVLGRVSTENELEYLKEDNHAFGQ